MIQAEKADHSLNHDLNDVDHDREGDHGVITVERMAELLGVSRSGYYAWVARQDAEPGPRQARREELLIKINGFHQASDGVNGAPRILADLREDGEVVSRKTVAKIMRDNGIAGSAHARGGRSPLSLTRSRMRFPTWSGGGSTRAS